MTMGAKAMCGRAAVTVLAGCLVGSTLTGCGSGPVGAPASFSEYNAPDGTFACDSPDGWEVKGGGKRGPQWATFSSGSASVDITADLAGSLMGSIASSFTPDEMEEAAIELEPVHRIHEQGKDAAERKFSGYAEVGSPQVFDVRLGPARKSEFTASSAFGSGLHGYRVTVLGHDKRVTVYAVCSESDWDTLSPAYDRVLASLKRGVAE